MKTLRNLLSDYRWESVLFGSHLITRVLAFAFGMRFDSSSIPYFYQYLDPDWLREDFWGNLFYLHSQPPLFNFFLGLGFQLPSHLWRYFFWGWYLLFGLAITLLLFRILVRLGISHGWACAITLIYCCSPGFMLMELWLFYPIPVVLMLLCMILMAHRYTIDGRTLDGLLLFSAAAGIALTRSAFHLVWLIPIVLLVALARRNLKKTALVALIPCLLVVGWYTKNQVVFGKFVSSTWLGMNFSRTTVFQLEKETRLDLIESGVLSQQSKHGPFKPLEVYGDLIPPMDPTGIPSLDLEMKSEGYVNLNHLAYIAVSDAYWKDSLAEVRYDPERFLISYLHSLGIFFNPTSENDFLVENLTHISYLDEAYNRLVWWRFIEFDWKTVNPSTNKFQILLMTFTGGCGFWVLAIGLCLSWGIYRGVKLIHSGENRAKGVVLLLIAYNVAFVTIVWNLFEYSENNRFRFLIESSVLIATATCGQEFLRRIRKDR